MTTASVGGSAGSAPRLARLEHAALNIPSSLRQRIKIWRTPEASEPSRLMRRIVPELRSRRPAREEL